MRLREDELWVRRIKESLPKGLKNNLHMLDLNLKDAPIRRRIPIDDLCTTPFDPTDPSIEKIRKALTRHFEPTPGQNPAQAPMQALVLPAALGNHIDHLTVREAALPLVATHPTAFYEDLPYAATHPTAAADLEALRLAAAERNDPLTEVLYRTDDPTEAAIRRKRKLVLNYASQVDEASGTLIANYATTYNGAERLWANPQWLPAFTSK
jgi:hypothetical protein